jgi:hypothetical protein
MRYILSFIVSLLFIGNMLAQVKKVDIDIYGEFEVVIKVSNGYVTINNLGKLVDININGLTDYHIIGSKAGKVQSVGSIYFDYYIAGARQGKLKQIGNIFLDYYIVGSREGKLATVGNTNFNYYILGDSEGKLASVALTQVAYYSIGSSEGKVESIGNNRFDYHITGSGEGKFQSGNRSAVYDGIRYRLRGGY